MKTQLRQAIITTSREAYLRYCISKNLSDETAKQVCRLSDTNEEFSGYELVDGSNNVTDFVINIFREKFKRNNSNIFKEDYE